MNKLAVGYVRVSSKNQDVNRQKEILEKYVEKSKFEIIEYFTMPTTPELSSNHWGSDAVLMEYKVNGSR